MRFSDLYIEIYITPITVCSMNLSGFSQKQQQVIDMTKLGISQD